MFVGVVEFVKEIQGALLAKITSFVWLQPLDCCLMFGAKRIDHFLPATVEVSPRTTAFAPAATWPSLEKDGELGPCERFFACAVEHTQLVDKAIQGRTEIMSDFADTDAQLQWWEDVYKSAERILSGPRIQLGYDNSIVGLCRETGIGRAESFDMAFCTRYLEAWAIKRMHDVYSDVELDVKLAPAYARPWSATRLTPAIPPDAAPPPPTARPVR